MYPLGIGMHRRGASPDGLDIRYAKRVFADGGTIESASCVRNVHPLLKQASLLLLPSGYKSNKLYSQIPESGAGDFSFSRSSTGGRTNSAGLIEEVPLNLFRYSEDFTNASWVKNNSSVNGNVTTAPNGTTTADKLVEDNVSSTHRVSQQVTVKGAVCYFYAKPAERTKVAINSPSVDVGFDLVNLTLINLGYGTTNAAIESVGNGWVKCSLYNTDTNPTFFIALLNASDQLTYVGDGISGLFLWGAQVNLGSTAKPYSPTTDRLNLPRLDYSFSTCPAILLEPQRTNLVLMSDDFGNASWAKNNSSIIINSTTSPDGTTNADTLVDNSTNALHGLIQGNLGGAGTYTFSFYAKANTLSRVAILTNSSVNANLATIPLVFDLSNGTIVNSVSGITPTITSVGNGWYRCQAVIPATTSGQYLIACVNSGTNVNYIGTGSSLFIYGAQLEAGSYATSYIPTTSASVTRTSDSFTQTNVYTNGLISSSGGTWFIELKNNIPIVRDLITDPLFLGDTTTANNNVLGLRFGGSSQRVAIYKRLSGALTVLFTTTTDNVKIAIKWNGTSADLFVNGIKQVSATAFTTTIMEYITGNGIGATLFIQGTALFNEPKSDQFCIDLTT